MRLDDDDDTALTGCVVWFSAIAGYPTHLKAWPSSVDRLFFLQFFSFRNWCGGCTVVRRWIINTFLPARKGWAHFSDTAHSHVASEFHLYSFAFSGVFPCSSAEWESFFTTFHLTLITQCCPDWRLLLVVDALGCQHYQTKQEVGGKKDVNHVRII